MDNSTLKKLMEEGEELLDEVQEDKELKQIRQHPFKKMWVLPLIIFIVVVALLGFGYVKYWLPFNSIMSQSNKAQASFQLAQKYLLQGEFKGASDQLEQAGVALKAVEKGIDALGMMARFGPLEKQRQALKAIAVSGQNLSSGLRLVTNLTNQIMLPLVGPQSKKFSDLTAAEKRNILKKVYEAAPDIQGAKAEVELAKLQMDQIDTEGLHPTLLSYVKDLRTKLNEVDLMLSQAAVMARTVPTLLGYPGEKIYLFLLQNNDELRPTGGFIGTVGIAKIKDAEVVSFETRNVYEMDVNAEKIEKITPPNPIAKYLKVKGWYLRDANWSPDFPTAVNQIEKLFQREARLSGSPFSPQNLDGVIAITPNMLEDFLKVSGAIEIRGFVFSSENFTERLEYLVEVGYDKIGESYSTRKNIIGLLGLEMIKRFQNLKMDQWVELFGILQKNLSEKQMLLSFHDPLLQEEINRQNWGGEVRNTPMDYFMFIDANLAALKTDQYVKRAVSYQIGFNNKGDLIARASMNYNNFGTFTWKSTRYRTYTRLYVPEGSKLIKTEGSMAADKSVTAGKTDVYNELGKTVFGAFISIEPGASGTLTFEYQLPERLKELILDGHYSLLAQKQAGTTGHGLVLNLVFPNKIKDAVPAEAKTEWGNNSYKLTTDLSIDREIKINF
ncbi:MAG: DUF4012 domain-containing protein [Patescibacteria group bacterium]|nr:DUF4012 domain-containing protein [Patescibacteria group bacterium]